MGAVKSNTNQERQIMKNLRFFIFVLILGSLVLSACGAAAAPSTPAPATTGGSAKVEAMPVAFVGIVDSIAGDQWVISGTTVTVDETVVRDGPFNVGDQVKVEGLVHPDGSVTISRVESPGLKETATVPPVSVDNSNEAPVNANNNDSNVNDTNSNDGNSSNDNSNGVNSNDSNSNDDNGGNSNDDNSNDDNGGNSNDDNSNDDNGGNSNDDNSNDDNGGSSNDDNGNDDNGGNSNDDNGNGG
jgi:hypothetical protein